MKESKIDFNNLTRQHLIHARKECDKSLLYFTRFWFRVLRGVKFTTSWHHDEIAKELDNIEKYNLELLSINIPPRHSKTELAAVNFIARGIGMNPKSNWLYITASDELRSQTSVSIRDIVEHPYFYIMYGVKLKKDQNSKNLWRTTQGGGLKTATIFGQITGFGAGQMTNFGEDLSDYLRTFEGAIVLDDINKTDDSEAMNATSDKVVRTLANTVLSRKNSRDTPIINIQQRTGENDATAFFMEFYQGKEDKAKFLIYPVLYNGKPLWEDKMTLEDIEQLKTSPKTAHVFLTQYMQDVTRTTQILFPKSQLKRFSRSEIDQEVIIDRFSYADIADTGSDSTSMPVAFMTPKRILIVDAVHTQDKMSDAILPLALCIDKNKVQKSRIEVNMGGSILAESIESKVTYKNNELEAVKAKGNKLSRIKARAAFILKHCYFLVDSEIQPNSDYKRFIDCLTSLKNDGTSKHDDAADALEGLCVMISSNYPEFFEV